MRIAHIRFLGLAIPLMLLLAPFVHQRVAGLRPIFSLPVDIILSFALAMGFCSPVFVYYANIRKHILDKALRPPRTELEDKDWNEVETEIKSFTFAAWIGLPIGVLAAIAYFYFL